MNDDLNKLLEKYYGEVDIAETTLSTYRRMLGYFAGYIEKNGLDPKTLSRTQLRAWLNGSGWAGNTRRIAHCAVRSFIRASFGKRHPALGLPVKSVDPGPQRTLNAEQMVRLIESQDIGKPNGLRNVAMVMLMLDSGLRAAEVCRLELKNVNLDDGVLFVKIKGGHTEYGALSRDTVFWLESWLTAREKVALPGVRNVFVATWGYHPGCALTRDGLRAIFRRMGKKAGLGLISPHDMRRTFATLMTENKAPTRITQIAGRWNRIEEVERYTRSLEVRKARPYLPVPHLWDKVDQGGVR